MNIHIPTVMRVVINKYYPCIIFIDECEKIINNFDETFLREFDGIQENKNIFLILATSHNINSNISRSGRIDKIINFRLPTFDNRRTIFKLQGFNQTEQIERLALQTANFTYADLATIPRELDFHRVISSNLNQDQILNQIINQIRFGYHTSSPKIEMQCRSRIAYHEIGHLIVSYVLGYKSNKLTLKPNGNLLGHVALNITDENYKTQSQLLEMIAIALASSISEKYHLKEYSTLCQDDFKQISNLFDIMSKNQMLGYNFLNSSSSNSSPPNESKIKYYMEKLEIFILDIIQQHSNIIKILHDKVILYETLMEDEISDIIGSELFNSIKILI